MTSDATPPDAEALDDGGPAFPETRWSDGLRQEVQWCGMTLRDYFAARFMERAQSLCETSDGWDFDTAADGAYQMADAMIKRRNS